MHSDEVTGTHTYAEEGIYHATINWKNSDGTSLTTPFDVKVRDAPLTASPVNFTAVAGAQFSGPVATFTDANPGGKVSDFTATIIWGDGTSSSGTVTAGNSGGFVVNGTHTYASTGSFTTTVSIKDAGRLNGDGPRDGDSQPSRPRGHPCQPVGRPDERRNARHDHRHQPL